MAWRSSSTPSPRVLDGMAVELHAIAASARWRGGLSLVELLTGERPGRVALAEGSLAKALFVYGLTQTMLNAPSPEYLAIEAPLAALCLGTFLTTNLVPATYERWHAVGLHVCPGLWSAIVAAGHAPLLRLIL